MASISILGCGWLGFPLAQEFVQRGFHVKGSTTTAEKIPMLEASGIEGYQIKLPETSVPDQFFETDFLVIDIPPSTSDMGPDHHLRSIQSIQKHLYKDQKVIYISSTSVYAERDLPIDESAPLDKQSERARALWQVEEWLRSNVKDKLTILRMSGLLGYNRIPGKYFSGKEVQQHQQIVNYVHRDDAVAMICQLIERDVFGDIFNVSTPIKRRRREIYEENAKKFNFPAPKFSEEKQLGIKKYIDGSKIELKIDYTFIYPDPLDFFYTS